MISKEEVKHIAKLARLGLTEDEIRKFQKELSSILDYMEKLKEVDIRKVEPYIRPAGEYPQRYIRPLENIMREDRVKEKKLETRKKMVEMAPEAKEGYLKTKPIL